MTRRPQAGATWAPVVPVVPWNRQRLRSNNEWLLLELLRTGGGSSRAQLARDTGLSKPTVSAALAELERAGLVREAGLVAPERGRTAVQYEVEPGAGHVLGVDIGRARLRVAVADLAGTVVARLSVANRGRTADAVADAVVAAGREAIEEAGLTAGRPGRGGGRRGPRGQRGPAAGTAGAGPATAHPAASGARREPPGGGRGAPRGGLQRRGDRPAGGFRAPDVKVASLTVRQPVTSVSRWRGSAGTENQPVARVRP